MLRKLSVVMLLMLTNAAYSDNKIKVRLINDLDTTGKSDQVKKSNHRNIWAGLCDLDDEQRNTWIVQKGKTLYKLDSHKSLLLEVGHEELKVMCYFATLPSGCVAPSLYSVYRVSVYPNIVDHAHENELVELKLSSVIEESEFGDFNIVRYKQEDTFFIWHDDSELFMYRGGQLLESD